MSALSPKRVITSSRRPARHGAPPVNRMRKLARRAEALDFEYVAFDLFFAVARLEANGRSSEVRAELAETATSVSGLRARFYWRAVRLLTAEECSASGDV